MFSWFKQKPTTAEKRKKAKEKRLDSMAASIAKVKREKAEREAKREAYLLTPEGKRKAKEKAERKAKAKAEREAKERAEREAESLLEDLTDISGVSDKVARTLMDKFKTQESIQKASAKSLTSIPGVGMSLAEAIKRRIG